MSTLNSKFLTYGDKGLVRRLENCANGSPTEAASHFTFGEKNADAVRRLQAALKALQEKDSSLSLPPFDVNGAYDRAFAKAVYAFKDARHIWNYANEIDDIIGRKTIKRIDDELADIEKNVPHVVPQPGHRPNLPSKGCVTDEECPTQTDFSIQLIAGGTAGELLEGGGHTFIVTDAGNRLSCVYVLEMIGVGTPGLPVNPSLNGKPVPFHTSSRTRITRFGPSGTLVSFTFTPPGMPPVGPWVKQILNTLTFTFRGPGANAGLVDTVTLHNFDMGPLPSVAGGSAHTGRFKLKTVCEGRPGATRF